MHWPSITERGQAEPFGLQVSRGLIAGHRTVVVFGFNRDVDQSEVTVWPMPSIQPHPASPVQMTVSSSNANDTAAGTGARTVVVEGLDANHNEVTEVVTMNGQTAVTMSTAMLHVNSAYVATAGSLNSAAGDIHIGTGALTAGVPATTYNIIKYNYNITTTGCYTTPAGHTGYLVQGLLSAGQVSGSSSIEGRLVVVGEDNIKRTAAITTINNGTANYAFELPPVIPEKTTVEATVMGSANNNSCSSMFVICLVKNDT
jgi:hypothetical protein